MRNPRFGAASGFLWESGAGLAPLIRTRAGAGKEPREAKSYKFPASPGSGTRSCQTPLIPGMRSGIAGAGAAGMGWEHPPGAFSLERAFGDLIFMGSSGRDSCFSQRYQHGNGVLSSPCHGFPGGTVWEFIPLGKTWMQHGNKRRNCCWGNGWS